MDPENTITPSGTRRADSQPHSTSKAIVASSRSRKSRLNSIRRFELCFLPVPFFCSRPHSCIQPFPTPPEGRVTRICGRSEEHTSELQSLRHLVCRLLLEKKKNNN